MDAFEAALPLYEGLRDGAYSYALEGYVRCMARLGQWDEVQEWVSSAQEKLAQLGLELDVNWTDIEAMCAARQNDWEGVDQALSVLEQFEMPEYLDAQCLVMLEMLCKMATLRQDQIRYTRIATLRARLEIS